MFSLQVSVSPRKKSCFPQSSWYEVAFNWWHMGLGSVLTIFVFLRKQLIIIQMKTKHSIHINWNKTVFQWILSKFNVHVLSWVTVSFNSWNTHQWWNRTLNSDLQITIINFLNDSYNLFWMIVTICFNHCVSYCALLVKLVLID